MLASPFSKVLAARNLAIALEAMIVRDAELPEWVQIMPAGTFRGIDGRGPYVNNDPAAVIAASIQDEHPLPFDYNHQTVFACLNGGEAPASGWIGQMDVREGAIWGKVEWTKRGAQAVQSKEYRFVSPTFEFDKKTGEIRRIVSVGLVNAPNLAELPAIASQTGDQTDMDEFLQALRSALGLPADADQNAIIECCRRNGSAAAASASALTPLATTLGLTENASVNEIATAVRKAISAIGKPDPAQYVPMAALSELQNEVAALKRYNAISAAETAVNSAMQAGKVTPALKDWALEYANQNPTGFADWVAKTPAVAKPAGFATMTAVDPPGASADTTSDATVLEVCSNLGITVDAFKKTREAMKKETR